MRILVTGGAGFVGSYYVRSLLTGGYQAYAGADVTVLDKLTNTGNLANLSPVSSNPRLRFVHGDVCDPTVVADVIAGQDLVVHFAAESHVDRSIHDAGPFVTTNVGGTQVLLDAARRAGVGRLVHVSTDEVYGSIAEGRWTEAAPVAPSSPYAASKAGADVLALAYHRTYGMDVVVTRACNNYGPYQFPEKIVPLFVTNLLEDRQVPLYGDGGHVREWLHVSDHCAGVHLVAEQGQAGGVYHIGGGAELTNTELTDRLLKACGKGWDSVRYVDDRKGHDRRYALDIGRSRRELGYAPSISIEDGLAGTVAWYREHRDWWAPLKARSDVLS